MRILDPEQLTGRVRTHVQELTEPRCTLHPQAARAFLALRTHARESGIELAPVSTFRDFEQQRAIWNAKFRGERPLLDRDGQLLEAARLSDEERVRAILLWSALPGASRHHWGSEIDVIDRAAVAPGARVQLVGAEYAPGGPFARLGAWLPRHCEAYGFFLPYDIDRGGVQVEPWHLSFAPLAAGALAALTLEVLREALQSAPVAGANVVLPQLKHLHARYVAAVAQPSTAALSPAATAS